MELEKLDLVELSTQEVQEVEGGTWPGIGWWMDVAFGCGEGSGGSGVRQMLKKCEDFSAEI